jgi:hypothetical protein
MLMCQHGLLRSWAGWESLENLPFFKAFERFIAKRGSIGVNKIKQNNCLVSRFVGMADACPDDNRDA